MERGATVSLFSLVIVGSEEEEEEDEKTEAGELSFTESKDEMRRGKKKDLSHIKGFLIFKKITSKLC